MNSVNFQNKNISFTSRNCPVKPQIFHSAKGDISIAEATRAELEEVVRFTEETAINFHDYYKDRRGKELSKESTENIKKGARFLEGIMNQYDGNSTILVARDKAKKLVGTVLLCLFPIEHDCQTGELINFYLAESARKLGLGKKMNELLVGTIKGKYTDIFVSAANESIDFYKKLGFRLPKKENYYEGDLSAYLANRRGPHSTVHILNLFPDNTVAKRLEERYGKK